MDGSEGIHFGKDSLEAREEMMDLILGGRLGLMNLGGLGDLGNLGYLFFFMVNAPFIEDGVDLGLDEVGSMGVFKFFEF